MFIKQITFNLGNTIPLDTLSKRQEDRYANVKPETSITIAFADGECDPATKVGKKVLTDAFALAQDSALEQLILFRKTMKELYA